MALIAPISTKPIATKENFMDKYLLNFIQIGRRTQKIRANLPFLLYALKYAFYCTVLSLIVVTLRGECNVVGG
jgi:hypothetical protein